MKRLGRALAVAALIATTLTFLGNAAGRFDQKLSLDKQIVHVLNRLTFGPRSGDAAEVRRLGIEKWIDLQLHPDRITENPALEAKLKPLESLKLGTWQIMEKYSAVQPATLITTLRAPVSPFALLPPLQTSKLMNGGTVEERRAVIASLDPDMRRQLLATAPPQVLQGLDDLQQEAAKVRQAEQEARQKELRRLMPPLNELLTPDQTRIARTGAKEEKLVLINSF